MQQIGLWYDDFNGGSRYQDLPMFLRGNRVNANDAPFKSSFPYVASPWAGTHVCDCNTNQPTTARIASEQSQPKGFNSLGLASPEMNLKSRPNPSNRMTSIDYSVDATSQVKLIAYDMQGRAIKVLVDKKQEAGVYSADFDLSNLAQGTYLIAAIKNGQVKQTIKVIKN